MIFAAFALARHSILIGNYLTTAPSGIAYVVDDKAAFVIDTAAPYYAGMAAPDDSYHRVEYTEQGARVVFEWGRGGDAAVGRLSSDSSVQLTLRLTQSWPGLRTTYRGTADGATGACGEVEWRMLTQPAPIRSGSSEVVVKVEPREPAVFVAGVGQLPSLDRVPQFLDAARAEYERKRPSSVGDWSDFLSAIPDNLNNSRIYSTDNTLVAHTVSRGWAPTPNDAPYFCWDSFFNGALACLDDPETAQATVRAILSWQTPEGLVPNFGHWKFDNSRASNDRSQPPVGSLCVWKMHERWPDLDFLREVYPKLLKWHRWWPTARDGNKNGLLEWGSETGQLQGAKWETGWDDTVAFEGAHMIGPNMNVDAIDLNSLWAMDAEYLVRIAKATGHNDDARKLEEERRATLQRIDKELWNQKLGIYCSKGWGGEFLTRLTPMNFYPLIAGVPDSSRAKKVLSILTDPRRFWGEWLLPTVAYDDPTWPNQDYWRGKVWAPVNYLVFQGMVRYADPKLLNRFADRSRELFMRNWTETRVCGENYLSRDGSQSSDPHYTWGALLCLTALENVCRMNEDGGLTLNGTLDAHAELRNVPFGGKRYDVVVKPRNTELRLNGKVVMRARGGLSRGRLP